MARLGWPVSPCWWAERGRCGGGRPDCASPGKHPIAALAPHGVQDATADAAAVALWWPRCRRASLALACGTAGWVLDRDDDKGGAATLARLEAENGPLPTTVTAITGSGGRHLYFAPPAGRRLPNSVGRVGPGLDVRPAGGYVIAPPSAHESGGAYGWAPGLAPWSAPLAPAPGWLLDRADPPAPPRPPLRLPNRPAVRDAYTRAALRRGVERVARAAPG